MRMRIVILLVLGSAFGILSVGANSALAAGDVRAGAQGFRACAACHTLESGRHLTGPSLAHLWGRKAGAIESFSRYSPALKSADIVWNDETLDAWLADPKAFVPGNFMTFPGPEDVKARADLIAFRKATGGDGSTGHTAQGDMMGGELTRGPELTHPTTDRKTVV